MPPEVAAIVKSNRPTISTNQAAKALHCTPYLLAVRISEGNLPFPAFKVGNRTKIPRIPFLRYLGYEGGSTNA